jgi:putative membrane protein
MTAVNGRAGRRRRRLRLLDVGSDPDYRFSLANERTFLAWLRTALALVAGGVAIVQFAPDLGSKTVRIVIGVVLILTAAVIAAAARWHWAAVERAMRLGVSLPTNRLATALSYGIALAALVVVVVFIVAEA